MNTALREGLVEIEGAIPTFASLGLEERAVAIGRIAADSYEHICGLLGFRPEIQLLVLSEADWPSRTQVPLYGLPNASNGTLVVAGTETAFWAELAGMVDHADRAGANAVTRLFEAFRLDDSALARRLEASVDPGLAVFSLTF